MNNSNQELINYESSKEYILKIQNIILKYVTLKKLSNPIFEIEIDLDYQDNLDNIQFFLENKIKPDIQRIKSELLTI
tara:strand:- start:232 stop:462 length:231 start_codon:yes stop_codon:yes gene_type:complete